VAARITQRLAVLTGQDFGQLILAGGDSLGSLLKPLGTLVTRRVRPVPKGQFGSLKRTLGIRALSLACRSHRLAIDRIYDFKGFPCRRGCPLSVDEKL